MKLNNSLFLEKAKPALKELLRRLSEKYAYAGILAQDSLGMSIGVSGQGTSVSEDALSTKRGFVVRVHNGKSLVEYAFNEISEEGISGIMDAVAALSDAASGEDAVPSDEPLNRTYSSEYEIDPEQAGVRAIVERLTGIRERCLACDERLADAMLRCVWQKNRRMFLSRNRELVQNILWTNASLVTLASDGNDMKDFYAPYSGHCGIELLDRINDSGVRAAADTCVQLLDAGQIPPGEYDCICDPDTTGMIVHEAFGHGVEMDMFVKDRALAGRYMGKKVASEKVTMHDGASAASECATYLFDDEGCEAHDTIIIKNGILVNGYADSVSAARLGVEPTGNGRRESYERKAYTRMTNTYFEGGKDKVEDMIASISYGFLLENPSSGMEDPKNWGIQCMVNIAREIRDGKLTGRIYSPIVLTGYVPDLLESISMMSEQVVLGGCGYCGKGYKEFIKVSDGGPYIKARIRLG